MRVKAARVVGWMRTLLGNRAWSANASTAAKCSVRRNSGPLRILKILNRANDSDVNVKGPTRCMHMVSILQKEGGAPEFWISLLPDSQEPFSCFTPNFVSKSSCTSTDAFSESDERAFDS